MGLLSLLEREILNLKEREDNNNPTGDYAKTLNEELETCRSEMKLYSRDNLGLCPVTVDYLHDVLGIEVYDVRKCTLVQ